MPQQPHYILDFDSEGENLEQTIISAIHDVESANLGATMISVAPEHLVSLSDIAALELRSRKTFEHRRKILARLNTVLLRASS